MPPPDVLRAHCNQTHPYYQEYYDWQRKRKKKRDSLSIEGIGSIDEEDVPAMRGGQPVVTVKRRVSDQNARTQCAATQALGEESPAPERENLVDVRATPGNDASGSPM